MRRAASMLVASLVLVLLSLNANAQTSPGKPIRIIVAFPAGGPTDILARVLAQKLNEGLGVPVVVENRSGAGGNLGADAVAKSAPDGQTVFLATISFVINPSLYARVGYDPVKDFAPINLVSSTPYMMLVHPSVPARSVRELIALAKSRPGQINYSSSGNGTAAHLAGVLFNNAAGVVVTHIPYNGAAPALTALLAGEVSLLFNNPITALPHMKSGKVRALAVTSAQRSAAAPEVPTLAQAGVPGVEVGSWSALFAPAGTAKETIVRLHNEVKRIVGTPEVRSRLLGDGAEPIGAGPDELAAFVKTELAKWAKVVAQSRARVD